MLSVRSKVLTRIVFEAGDWYGVTCGRCLPRLMAVTRLIVDMGRVEIVGEIQALRDQSARSSGRHDRSPR